MVIALRQIFWRRLAVRVVVVAGVVDWPLGLEPSPGLAVAAAGYCGRMLDPP
jgi:hypothetical protein